MHFGGYTIIRFEVTNPASYIGWWFIHCHIKIHQLNGMAAVACQLICLNHQLNYQLRTLPISCTMQYFVTGVIFTGDNQLQSMHVHIFGISVGN